MENHSESFLRLQKNPELENAIGSILSEKKKNGRDSIREIKKFSLERKNKGRGHGFDQFKIPYNFG